jgi:hypothetical protein
MFEPVKEPSTNLNQEAIENLKTPESITTPITQDYWLAHARDVNSDVLPKDAVRLHQLVEAFADYGRHSQLNELLVYLPFDLMKKLGGETQMLISKHFIEYPDQVAYMIHLATVVQQDLSQDPESRTKTGPYTNFMYLDSVGVGQNLWDKCLTQLKTTDADTYSHWQQATEKLDFAQSPHFHFLKE